MDDGVAAALFALLLGAPMILFAGLFAGLTSALATLALVGSIAVTFLAANWIATRQETSGSAGAPSSETPRHSSRTSPRSSESSRYADTEHHCGGADSSLETLRERYARGELTDAEFERKAARLLETETPADGRRNATDRDREYDPN
ncbi:SHOCT domain-containing protein [Salinadaptatus halalkaliphilus]|uniref:SHOCT domain-containing protein n=1 Tax=Salinadaptatus halalkaliphilus TaxID=2419781 RepID=A0A4V3VLL5_9EURY|nr:SHOCT domain-containing protein [Salinadaptatus halalkaliphilus]THE66067.1 SHOCT domain-containing protein [Salinadaptatus halalkaliphilus]